MGERDKRESSQYSRGMTRRRFLQTAAAIPLASFFTSLDKKSLVLAEEENLVISTNRSLPQRINGLDFSSWRRGEYQESPAQRSLIGVSEVSPNLIGVKVTEYQDTFDSLNIGPTENTADANDLKSIINLAHKEGYGVMLSPQINLSFDPLHWHGEIGANFTDSDWRKWFVSYNEMIDYYATLGQITGVELFVVGNEYIQAVSKRPGYWRETIRGIRNIYRGPLTYAAHYFEFDSIPFWDELDLLGLNPYYKLSDNGRPNLEGLKTSWSNIIQTIEPTVRKFGKDLLFPEVGYPSVKGASSKPWNYSLITDPSVPIDIAEQTICYQALYESFWPYPWWRGICWWNWDTDPNVNGLDNKTYSPRGKPAAEVIAYYSKVLSGSL